MSTFEITIATRDFAAMHHIHLNHVFVTPDTPVALWDDIIFFPDREGTDVKSLHRRVSRIDSIEGGLILSLVATGRRKIYPQTDILPATLHKPVAITPTEEEDTQS